MNNTRLRSGKKRLSSGEVTVYIAVLSASGWLPLVTGAVPMVTRAKVTSVGPLQVTVRIRPNPKYTEGTHLGYL